MPFDNILVVCVGNICRSTMAEALLRQRFPNKAIDYARLSAVVGHSTDSKALDVMIASNSVINLEMSDHIAKQVSEELLRKSNLIFAMSTNQIKWIEDQWLHCRDKNFRIGHWINKDVADPYGYSELSFETAKQDIIDSLDQWFNKIS